LSPARIKWEVHDYSSECLRQLLSKNSRASEAVVAQKTHCVYFEGYFNDVGARTVVVEKPYVDRDFLEDFAAYYVRCFEEYDRFCTRLHFFTCAFDSARFSEGLETQDTDFDKELAASYLGFIVVKPLPEAIIGRTCLKTYPNDGHRFYPITRKYDASLVGLCLKVSSLAFQEQDQVAAACATSALWSTFHGTGIKFQHPIPSPVEITRSATERGSLDVRPFPSRGLTANQMMDAARRAGLDPVLLSAKERMIVKAASYAYVCAGIPTVIIGTVVEVVGNSEHVHGRHAVVVTGYSLGSENPETYGPVGTVIKAGLIDKLYCHDDQVGPFARMTFAPTEQSGLSTSWHPRVSEKGAVVFRPQQLLIPLYHKIRIPFETVLAKVMAFDGLLQDIRTANTSSFPPKFEWDIRLTDVVAMKDEARVSAVAFPTSERRNILERQMPRFLWRATATFEASPILDVIFDATAIESENHCVCVIEHNRQLGDLLRKIYSLVPSIQEVFSADPIASGIVGRAVSH
jgi:hypothetical protein